MPPDRDYPKVAYQDGDAFLIDTGRLMPHRDPTLTEGRVYDREAGTLAPRHGGPLAVGSYLNHGEWYDVTVTAEEVAAMEAHVAALLAAEK